MPEAEGLNEVQMQQIAREFNFSETAFVFPPEQGQTRKVRIFTPTSELPFAGHPNLGTAFSLYLNGYLGEKQDSMRIVFEEKARICVVFKKVMNSERLQYLKLNKNIFIAFLVSMTISALGANYFADQIELLNSTITLMIDHSVYYAVFGTLFYLDNKKKYILENGKINRLLLKSDLLKIVLSFGSSEIIYSIVRWGVQYELLILNYDAYMASVISHIIAAIIRDSL